MKAAIVYWGRRGGGPRQILNLARVAQELQLDIKFFLSPHNELLQDIQSISDHVVLSDIPRSTHGLLLSPTQKRKTCLETFSNFKSMGIGRVFFLLPHPWDLQLAKLIHRNSKIEVWRAIHDLRKHPGDFWPTTKTIGRMIEYSSTLVTYSNHVATQLERRKLSVVRTSIIEAISEAKGKSLPGRVLFIGRIRKYKGLNLLADAWPMVKNSEKTLVIAGEGKLFSKIEAVADVVLNKWLTNEEIVQEILKSEIVVLPYIEASQSGIIPLANALAKPVVVTPVGGLTEQIIHEETGIVAGGVSSFELAAAIDVALSKSWQVNPMSHEPLVNFLNLLTK